MVKKELAIFVAFLKVWQKFLYKNAVLLFHNFEKGMFAMKPAMFLEQATAWLSFPCWISDEIKPSTIFWISLIPFIPSVCFVISSAICSVLVLQ